MEVRTGSDETVRGEDEKKIRASVHKTEATSRRSRGHINLTSRCPRGVATDVARLEPTSRRYRRGSNGDQPTSRRSGSTSRRDRG